MKISYKWLKEYLDLTMPAKELAEKIERTAVEVDSVTSPADGLKKIIVGQVMSMEDHPDSDHLHVCQVDIGEEELSQIVCGAPNVAVGQKVIVSLPGARIADNVKIKRSKMRGVTSNGMICALEEIGFSKDVVPKEWADGIYVLPTDAVVGDDVYSYLGMDDDLIDLDVTPNRGDMLSVFGTVHELAAIYNQKVTIEAPTVKEDASVQASDQVSIEVADENLASTYKMRLVSGVKIEPSPLWLQIKLWNAGIRPINNVVDITNYVLQEYGQPLHAFDFDAIEGSMISVRNAKAGETLVTLDEGEHELDTNDIVIASQVGPIALAGVMGGQSSQITDGTTTVAIEAAVFNSTMIRKTAQRQQLHTDAAQHFERGINLTGVQEALDAAAKMVQELAGGTVATGTVVGAAQPIQDETVRTSRHKINKVLGTDLSAETITDIFTRLGFGVSLDGDDYTVTIPPRRWDIHIEADLLEEVARIYGYDELPATLPTGSMTLGVLTEKQRLIRNSHRILEGLGLTQAISYSLTTEAKAKMFLMKESDETTLAWPMSSDHAFLRESLISGLLDDIAYNRARNVKNVALYESGRVFYRHGEQVRPDEEEHIAGAVMGSMVADSWNTKAQPVDFYQVKGIVEAYLKNLAVEGDVEFVADQSTAELHPGRAAKILVHGHEVGFMGEVHPVIIKQFKIDPTVIFELNLQQLIDMPKQANQYQTISKFPSVSRDIAMLVDETITNDQIVAVIEKRGGAHLSDVHLFDVYAGKGIPKGKKSLAYSLVYQDKNATLVDEDVTSAFNKVVDHLQSELSAEIR